VSEQFWVGFWLMVLVALRLIALRSLRGWHELLAHCASHVDGRNSHSSAAAAAAVSRIAVGLPMKWWSHCCLIGIHAHLTAVDLLVVVGSTGTLGLPRTFLPATLVWAGVRLGSCLASTSACATEFVGVLTGKS